MWRIWGAPNSASRWLMEFKSAFKGLTLKINLCTLDCCTNRTYIENNSEQFVEWTVSNQKRGDAIINL